MAQHFCFPQREASVVAARSYAGGTGYTGGHAHNVLSTAQIDTTVRVLTAAMATGGGAPRHGS